MPHVAYPCRLAAPVRVSFHARTGAAGHLAVRSQACPGLAIRCTSCLRIAVTFAPATLLLVVASFILYAIAPGLIGLVVLVATPWLRLRSLRYRIVGTTFTGLRFRFR